MPSANLARDLGTTDRTLRRLAEVGAVRPRRRSSGHRPLPESEERWLKAHWGLVSDLRSALRTEPRVRAALLFGSVSRGTDGAGSDVDLLLDLDTEDPLVLGRVRRRLQAKLGPDRRLDLLTLADLEAEPQSLVDILPEARPILDRAGVWARLGQRRRTLRSQAARRRAAMRFGAP